MSAAGQIMSEADTTSQAYLEEERDGLKFDLIVWQGHLMKEKLDFSCILGPLLADTAPATIEGNARMKRHVDRMKAQLESLNKPDLNKPTTSSPAPPPPATAAFAPARGSCRRARVHDATSIQSSDRAPKRRRVAPNSGKEVSGDAIWSTAGEFPVFAPMLQKTIEETGAAARWAVRVMRTDLKFAGKARNITKWLYQHWETEIDGEHAPFCVEKFRSHVTGGYLAPSNLLRAAQEDNIQLIEIARGRVKRSSNSEVGNVSQENFKRWAIDYLADMLSQDGLGKHEELSATELQEAVRPGLSCVKQGMIYNNL